MARYIFPTFGSRNFPTLGSVGDWRTWSGVPLRQQGEFIGALVARHIEVRPFTSAQIKLLETFTDQAVIALANVRLFQELKESLEQQTATSEILGVIASSPTDIQPVLDAVAESAARLCEATNAEIYRVDSDVIHPAATHGAMPPAPKGTPLNRGRPWGEPLSTGKRNMFTICLLRLRLSLRILRQFERLPALVPVYRPRCCVKEFQLARFMSVETKSALSQRDKSNSSKASPTRR